MEEDKYKKATIHGLVLILIIILSVIYIGYTWKRFKNDQTEKVLQIARSIVAALPVDDLMLLEAKPDDIDKPQYKLLKNKLKAIIGVNTDARFAYLYTERNGNLYFYADSEPEDSKDYSSPGQEYTEAKPEDKQPFIDGKDHVTPPLSDRWGTWVSVYVPVKDEANDKIIAVFGMDFNAKYWNVIILYEVIESSVLILILLFLVFFLFKFNTKNKLLQLEIAERKLVEGKLRESEARMKFIVKHDPSAIAIYDRNMNYIAVSDRYLQDYNITEEDIIGKHHYEVFPEIPQKWKDVHQRCLAGATERNDDDSFVRFDGSLTYNRWECIPWYGIGNEIGGIITYTEVITERKIAEAEIKFKNEELQKVNAEKDKFFSIISHDLRSPFNSFLGLTQIMAEDLPSLTMDEIKQFSLSMKNSATNLFRLLENLLEWAQIQQGLVPFNQEIIQLLPNVYESVEMIHGSIEKKEIKIKYEIPGDTTVSADNNILQTVIRNLVSNAVKFTPRGGSIIISAKQISDHFVEVSIEDTGVGMSKQLIENLFRLDVNTSRKGTEGESSTGLGLIICKDLVKKLGGKLWVESEENRVAVGGSLVCFSIPIYA